MPTWASCFAAAQQASRDVPVNFPAQWVCGGETVPSLARVMDTERVIPCMGHATVIQAIPIVSMYGKFKCVLLRTHELCIELFLNNWNLCPLQRCCNLLTKKPIDFKVNARGVTIYIDISQYKNNFYCIAIRNLYRNILWFFFLLIKVL